MAEVTIKVALEDEDRDRIDALVKAVGATAKAAAAPAAAKANGKAEDPPAETKAEEPASDGPSRDDVRAALKDFSAIEGKPAAVKILKEHGAASISELAEDKFASVIAAATA